MDTISSEPKPSYLPVGALIASLVALVFAIVAFAKVNSAQKDLAAQGEQIAKVSTIETTAQTAQATAERAQGVADKAGRDAASALRNIESVARQTEEGFKHVVSQIETVRTSVASAPKGSSSGSASGSGPAPVAGPGEYLVKSGDTGSSIARANNTTVAALEAVNPGIDWRRLKIGQAIKLPQK